MKLKSLPLFLFILLLTYTRSFSQLTETEEELIAPSLSLDRELNFRIDFSLHGVASSEEKLPFWLYHNQRGRLSEDSNFAAWLSGKHVLFFTRDSYLLSGAGILYQDGRREGAYIDEAYLHFQNTWLYVTAGRKQKPKVYNGVSASNRSILWSVNARPLPGIQVGTVDPIFFSGDEGLGFEGSWNEYLMGNNRYVQGTRLHHKNLFLVYRKNDWQVKTGIQHFVQWAGTSPRTGEQPDGFTDYLKLITAQPGGANATINDQLLALGNHVGGYELHLTKQFQDFELQVFYNHLFEDGSGMMLRNTPDGRYGIFYQTMEKDKLVNSVIYEFYYTAHQSYTFPSEHRYDDYFNSGSYRSGWTYEDRVLGAPFFTPHPTDIGIINNKFRAHHLGIGGQLSYIPHTFPYRLLLSYSRNDGRYLRRFRPKQNVVYSLFDIKVLEKIVDVNLQFATEFNSYTKPLFGGGIYLKYRID